MESEHMLINRNPFQCNVPKEDGYECIMIRVTRIYYGKHKETKGMRYGNLHEAEACNNYHQKLLIPHPLSSVSKTGTHIDTKDRWLSALPDGRVNLGDDSSG